MKGRLKILGLMVGFLFGTSQLSAQCITAPFSESFDTGLTPACIITSATTGGPWDFNGIGWNTSGCPAPTDHTGNSGFWASMDQSGTDVGVIMEFDTIDVSGLTNPYLQFYYFMCGVNYTPPNILAIETFDGTTWVGVDTIQQGTAGWELFAYDLTANTFGTGYLKVRFRAESGGSGSDFIGDQGIDDISVTALPTCFVSGGQSTSNLTTMSVDVSWVDPNSATSWQIEYGVSPLTIGTGTRMVTSSNPATIGSLTANTSYDWTVRAICGAGDTAAWTGVSSFFTGYCTPNPSSVDGSGITNVSFGVVNNTTGTEVGNYGDYTNLVGDAIQGISTPLDITYSTGFTYVTEVYIDWNNDLDFDDTLENVYSGVSTNANPTTLNASFTVPATQPLGQYRMRIGGADTGPPTPCYTGSWGSFEDYTVNVIAPPNCLFPQNLASTAFAFDSALVSWSDPNAATMWEVEWDTAGYTLGTASNSTIVMNDTFLLIGNLMGQSSYTWAVRAICGPADTSAWSSQNTFTTPCAPFTAPFVERFPVNSLPACWTQGGNTPWEYGPGFNAYGAANVADNSPGGTGRFIGMDGSDNSGSDSSWLISPMVDVSGLTAPQLRYYIFSNNTNDAALNRTRVHVWDGSVWIQVDSIQANLGPNWVEMTYDLSALSISNITAVRFTITPTTTGGSAFYNDILLDDIEFRETPLCPEPNMLGTANLTTDSVTAFWTEQGTATQYEVEWDTAGYTIGMAANSAIVNVDTFYTITGLMGLTSYDWAVRAICGPADTSIWSQGSFQTPIPGPQPLACPMGTNPTPFYSDEFDAVGGWTGSVGTGTTAGQWNFGRTGGTPSGATGPLAAHSGSAYAYVEASGTTGAPWGTNVIMVSPAIDLTAATGDAELSFWMHAFGQTMGTLNVGIGTSATGPFTNVFTYAGQLQGAQADPYQNVGVDLTAFIGQTIYLEFDFLVGSNFYSDIAIDLLEVTGCASCVSPSNLSASNAGLTSVDLDWTENGVATNWELEYGPSGYTPGTGTKVVTTSKPYSLSSLTASTGYDFYVRSICNVGDTSAISPVGGFATLNGVPYTQDFENFTNGNIINDEGWFSTSAAAPYWSIGSSTGSSGTGPTVDHTIGAGGKFAFLETSGSYPALTPDTLIGPAIITGNGDSLLELSFWYHMHGSTMGDLQIWITGALNGPMMIGTISGQQQVNQTDPWLLYSNLVTGYQNDTVRIVYVGLGTVFTSDMAIDDVSLDLPPANNLAMDVVSAPTSGCGLSATESVTVSITNLGSAAQTGFSVGYSLNGVAITPETFTGTINPGATSNYTYTTTANLSTPGQYDITAYTLLAGDANTSNDTADTEVNSVASASLPYAESFENGPANWFVTGISTFDLGTPAGAAIVGASDGDSAWVTGLTFNYSNGEEGYLNSPCFDLSGTTNPWISFDINYDIESQWDGALMQVSTNGGTSWSTLGMLGDTVNWYNDTADVITALGIDPTGQCWTGDGTGGILGSGGWINARHELSAYAGQSSVRFRLLFASDGAVVAEGIGFDNVRVYDSIPPAPYYPIGIINTVDANGVADSLGVEVRTSGTVVGVDLDGNNGLSFYIIDMSTSVQEGINIFNFNDVSNYVVNEGDSIMVWGDIDQFNGLQEVFVDSIMIIKTNALVPAPRLVTALDESTEANHIEIRNLTVLQASGSGSYNMDLTDGTNTFTMRVDADTDVNDSLNISPLIPGDTVCSVIGIGGQFDNSSPYTSGYQIFPMRFSDLDTTSCQATGIEDIEVETSQLNIFPNPTTGMVTIQASDIKANDARFMVRDISGKILFEDRINKSEFSTTIDFSDRANGIYFITIIDGEKMIHEKLIKN